MADPRTPKQDGFYAPAEWSNHSCCLIAWPWRTDVWPYGASRAREAYLEAIRNVCATERVILVAKPGTLSEHYMKALGKEIDSGQVEVCHLDCSESWMRDTGPTFVVSRDGSSMRGVNWVFNGWGGTLLDCCADMKLAGDLCEHRFHCGVYSPDLVCEGGALAWDGDGTVVTTESVLLNDNRNGKGKTKAQVEKQLLEYLGCEKVIWLPRGVYGDDDTNGHVDNLVAFVQPGEVVLCWTDDIQDPQYLISVRAELILKEATDARGRRLTIHHLHQPDPVYFTAEEEATIESSGEIVTCWRAGKRLPASYVNFYIANKAVVVPQYNQFTQDKQALEVLKRLFPERKVIGVPARDIVAGGGGIHCITQQVPATVSS